jgi:hypothetical protein
MIGSRFQLAAGAVNVIIYHLKKGFQSYGETDGNRLGRI